MKYLILGAGPSGLTFADRLKSVYKENSFLVLEKEHEAGGLCRSKIADNAPIDIGGGHVLDVRRPHVTEYLFHFMPETEWDRYVRDSRIDLNGRVINHPIEANIWQLPIEEQVEYLESIAKAGCNSGQSMPEKFVDWIYWKLGEKIAADYMIPYNQKMFGDELNELGTYWLEKLPSVSFKETLLSCLTKKAYGKQPGHAEYYYPKHYGYGELWLRMAKTLEDHIKYNSTIRAIDFDKCKVTTSDGEEYTADKIITTIPWNEFIELRGLPEDLVASVRRLKHTAVQIKYFPDNVETDSQWTYFPNLDLSYHRICYRHTVHRYWNGYWTETRSERISSELEDSKVSFLNAYAYPLNTIEKPTIMQNLLSWCRERNVYGLGRWGEHQHYNSDVVVERAMKLAEQIFSEGGA